MIRTLSQVGRVIRAFFKAWALVLTGRAITPKARPHPEVWAWVEDGEKRIDTVYRIADKLGYDLEKRKGITLTIDKRPIAMETILAAVRHNLTREYPSLLASGLEYSLLTLRSFNINDQHRIERLGELEIFANTPLNGAIQALSHHLSVLPLAEGDV